jgi:hypothetical protein
MTEILYDVQHMFFGFKYIANWLVYVGCMTN